MLSEMNRMFAPCPNCHSFSMLSSRGNPESGGTPPSLHDPHPHASFCTSISVSYRNRYVAVASFSDMLPWHHFCFAAVAPFSFRHGDQMLLIMLYVNIFIKLHKTCICHPHHDNNIKNVVCIKLLNDIWGFTRIVLCCSVLI